MCTRRLAVLLVLAALAPACGLGRAIFGEGTPQPIEVVVEADAKLNPDDARRPLPTVIRLLQVRSAAKLERAEFDQVYRGAKELLGEDLLQVDELIVSPGATVTRKLERDKAARALVAVAVVRSPSGTSWRAVADLPAPGDRATVTFHAEEYRIARR